MYKWYTELNHRIIPSFISEIRSCRKLHRDEEFLNDRANWEKVQKIKISLMKDTDVEKGIFNQMRDALCAEDYSTLSLLQKKMYSTINDLREAYKHYRDNLLELV